MVKAATSLRTDAARNVLEAWILDNDARTRRVNSRAR
jgi:hypothetical protein